MNLRRQSLKTTTAAALVALLLTMDVRAVINPTVQPDVYFKKYPNVVVLEITRVDAGSATLACSVVKAIKGDYKAGETVTVTFVGEMASQVGARETDGELYKGYRFPVFAGKPSKRRRLRQIRMYADMFYVGEVKARDAWHVGVAGVAEKDAEGRTVNTLAGIYCGMTSQLIKMLEDMSADRDFYPRKAYVKFKPDILIDELPKSVEGVALYDINGDGMEDIVACSPGGDRVYFQLKPMQFTNVTEQVGLTASSVSCSLADVDCDGLTDILLDAAVYRGKFEKNQYSFVATEWLPAGNTHGLKSAAFVELNGDGWPDVVMSVEGSGLRAFINPGDGADKDKREFVDATASLGLDQADCGADGNGYFMPGDWNGDRRADLFYSHGSGYLLVQNGQSRFEPVPHEVEFSFRTGVDDYGRTGAGVFMPTMSPDVMDLMVPIEKDWLVIRNRDGKPVDISKWGNEISEGSDYHLATVASDLNVDGHVDIYTVCDKRKENRYIINRGYGSYMHGSVHVDEKPLFRGPAHGGGGRSLAAGDVNDDGAPDIVIGNEDGKVFLVINDTLSMRVEKPIMLKDAKRLMQVRLCTVRVLGPKGVVNSRVRICDDKDVLVGRRDLATNVATGCRGPDMVTFAVRGPGKYKVNVEWSDGHKRDFDVDLTTEKRAGIVAERGDQDDDGW